MVRASLFVLALVVLADALTPPVRAAPRLGAGSARAAAVASSLHAAATVSAFEEVEARISSVRRDFDAAQLDAAARLLRAMSSLRSNGERGAAIRELADAGLALANTAPKDLDVGFSAVEFLLRVVTTAREFGTDAATWTAQAEARAGALSAAHPKDARALAAVALASPEVDPAARARLWLRCIRAAPTVDECRTRYTSAIAELRAPSCAGDEVRTRLVAARIRPARSGEHSAKWGSGTVALADEPLVSATEVERIRLVHAYDAVTRRTFEHVEITIPQPLVARIDAAVPALLAEKGGVAIVAGEEIRSMIFVPGKLAGNVLRVPDLFGIEGLCRTVSRRALPPDLPLPREGE